MNTLLTIILTIYATFGVLVGAGGVIALRENNHPIWLIPFDFVGMVLLWPVALVRFLLTDGRIV